MDLLITEIVYVVLLQETTKTRVFTNKISSNIFEYVLLALHGKYDRVKRFTWEPILSNFPALGQPQCSPEIWEQTFLCDCLPTVGCKTVAPCCISVASMLKGWIALGPLFSYPLSFPIIFGFKIFSLSFLCFCFFLKISSRLNCFWQIVLVNKT